MGKADESVFKLQLLFYLSSLYLSNILDCVIKTCFYCLLHKSESRDREIQNVKVLLGGTAYIPLHKAFAQPIQLGEKIHFFPSSYSVLQTPNS